MLPQQYCLRWKYHHSNLQTMFSQLLDRGCFCDVTLACEGQLIRAHRVVLCACSTFFDTVLTNYASERDPIIIMKDVTFADVKCLIEFMYKGEINVEHAHLASLLKTADDLKIKGLAEVSWRDDDDGPPPPTPATEFHSPTRVHEAYLPPEQLRASPLSLEHQLVQQQQQQQQQQHHQHQQLHQQRERKSASPRAAHTQTRMPTLTPIPPPSSGMSIAAAAVAAAAAAAASPVEQYLGPKRKRGRPPLDDAYDVFNVRKLAQYAGHLEAHHAHNHHQTYVDARHYGEEQRRLSGASPAPTTTAAAAAAYQQHIHQQQTKQRMRHHRQHQRSESEEVEPDDPHADPEWITSNLEVNVAECEPTAHAGGEDADAEMKEHKLELEEKELTRVAKSVDKKRRERTPEQREKLAQERAARKHSNSEKVEEEKADGGSGGSGEDQQQRERSHEELAEQQHEPDEEEPATTVPQPVEEIETVQQSMEAGGGKSASKSSAASAPPPLHHAHYGKYAPEGYMLNEHGMLMTHDFVHASGGGLAAAAVTSSTSGGGSGAGSSGNGNTTATNGSDPEYADIKMEDYDAADMRLTSEEMSQWQDVIKMDDYLAKGRRPQFWEEPFTRRVLDAIKNKRLEMKKAARILGVSYGTLYGRYREVYGCLKHPYSSTTFRPSQSSQLTVQPRFDIVWPPKRDGALLPGQLEIGKIRPKDLSELWTRPQL